MSCRGNEHPRGLAGAWTARRRCCRSRCRRGIAAASRHGGRSWVVHGDHRSDSGSDAVSPATGGSGLRERGFGRVRCLPLVHSRRSDGGDRRRTAGPLPCLRSERPPAKRRGPEVPRSRTNGSRRSLRRRNPERVQEDSSGMRRRCFDSAGNLRNGWGWIHRRRRSLRRPGLPIFGCMPRKIGAVPCGLSLMRPTAFLINIARGRIMAACLSGCNPHPLYVGFVALQWIVEKNGYLSPAQAVRRGTIDDKLLRSNRDDSPFPAYARLLERYGLDRQSPRLFIVDGRMSAKRSETPSVWPPSALPGPQGP